MQTQEDTYINVCRIFCHGIVTMDLGGGTQLSDNIQIVLGRNEIWWERCVINFYNATIRNYAIRSIRNGIMTSIQYEMV